MENNKNTFIAIALMLGVWVVFSILFPPTKQEPADQQEKAVVEQVMPAQEGTSAPAVMSTVAPSPAVATPTPAPAEEKEIVVQTDLYKAVFTSIGARLKHLELNKYRVEDSDDSPLVSIIDSVNPGKGTFRLNGSNGIALSSEAPYSISTESSSISLSGEETRNIKFTTATAEGVVVEKEFTLHGSSYAIDLGVRVSNNGTLPVRGGLDLALVQQYDDSVESDQFSFTGGATLLTDEVEKVDIDDLKEKSVSYGKSARWSAYETKYFISALVPLDNASEQIQVRFTDDNMVENSFSLSVPSLNPGMTTQYEFMSYLGPRNKDILEAVNYDLAKAIDYGFFSVISEPLLWFMNTINDYTHNYGIAIILLTVLIKLLFWPLTHKSYVSMKSMQKLQPEIQKIRERFKNDRTRQGQETMELYKKHRVNPMSGCLPMLIQIPVFFALYRVLYEAIELRHADFLFWITDLSAKDPYYITPIVMGATMFIQQKMTPTTMDPTQAKIFLMMPVVFTVMFLNFPAGLVIYWLINNLLTIAQQYYIHKKFS